MHSTVFRILFPMAPVGVIFGAMLLAPQSSSGSAYGLAAAGHNQPVLMSAKSLSACCQKIPTRGAMRQKYTVKYAGQNMGGVDYDAGGAIIQITCTFTDLDTERPVVGMGTQGLLRRIQTDTGAVIDGQDGYAVITPGIESFKDAQFHINAKVPLQTSAVMMLNGALTVLRAEEKAQMSWREPFGPEVGSVKKSAGIEISLSKIKADGDMMEVEWSCKPSADGVIDNEFWSRRQVVASLVFADKTVSKPESGTETPYLIRRIFRHNKKFPVQLNLEFISKLTQENLPFTLTDISLEGTGAKKSNGGNPNF